VQHDRCGVGTGSVLGGPKGEGRNRGLKDLRVIGDTDVVSVHAPQRTVNAGATGVLKGLARLQIGLLPDDAQPPYLLSVSSGVFNHPVTGNDLGRQATAVGDRHRIGKGEDLLTRAGLVGQKLRVDRDMNEVFFHGL